MTGHSLEGLQSLENIQAFDGIQACTLRVSTLLGTIVHRDTDHVLGETRRRKESSGQGVGIQIMCTKNSTWKKPGFRSADPFYLVVSGSARRRRRYILGGRIAIVKCQDTSQQGTMRLRDVKGVAKGQIKLTFSDNSKAQFHWPRM
jgi:hypothetical protein